ncbi:thiaminase /4-amino-5-aminomethyl-2-methylpyrimidine deaminase [Tamaricihabitans halophyticus]|uniref:Aminopyrimidine aminohydrolase n=1 Tax=Tamaricihabitans halophyticus TaxID=1262583 RepID=A0A4R2R5R8_9PSEU|nr:thiaminase II [Tamaricihabitans halophyticus]TCP57128.1 thiaminase /4-amino-5-aminomethyl-2-methylpyrimidine deaminase [Tamaricihabitans halophyticus]
MSGFCAQAWRHTERIQQAVLELPFNLELADGSLSRQRFQFYLAQDSRYLLGFGRALAVAAARADQPEELAFFSGAAQEAVLVERQLHESYFRQFGLSQDEVDQIETSPTCLGYTSYLLSCAQSASYGELIAALLPCFWVYHHVGTDILRRQTSAENPFQEWINTYADDEFAASVTRCQQAVDRAAEHADLATRDAMLAAFTKASEYEWMFWDSAYRLEGWPTAHLR